MFDNALIGRQGIYRGNSRRGFFGDQPCDIINSSEDGERVEMQNSAGYSGWVHINSVELADDIPTFDVDEIFTDAAGGPLAVAKAEIERLEARLTELKAAVKVIESV